MTMKGEPGPATTNAPAPRVRVLLQFIGICFVAGSGSYLTALALQGFGFTQVAWSRALLGALTLGTAAACSGSLRIPRSWRVWGHLLVLALCNLLLPYLLLAWALQYIDSSTGAVLNATVPLLSLMLSTLVFRTDRVTAVQGTALGIGLLGVVLVLQPWRVGVETAQLVGALACLGSAACFALSFAYTRRFLPPEVLSGTGLGALTAAIGAGYFLVLSPFLVPGAIHPTVPSLVGVVLLGVFGSGLGLLWSLNVLRAWGPVGASLPMYAAPVIGLALGMGLLHETPGALQILGAAVTIAALALAAPRRGG